MTTRSRFAEVVRSEPVDAALACLLVGGEVEPDLDITKALGALDALAATVQLTDRGPAGAARALEQALGVEAGFRGTEDDYDDVRSSLLHEVLRRGRGLPITLSLIWREVARRAGIPAHCLGLPGHVLLLVGDPEAEHVVVDPFAGGGPLPAPAEPVLDGADLVLRVLTNIRALTARQGHALETVRTRLWATELSLLLPRHPLDLRRERGELLVRLGEHVAGAQELESYALAVPDDDVAEKARRVARLARSRLN